MSQAIPMDHLIALYDLKPLEREGGFFAETYRSSEHIPKGGIPARFKGDRAFSTAIYYLLPKGVKSRLHRMASDEVWHFYLGGALTLVVLHPADGRVEKVILGSDVMKGQKVQHVVPAGRWFGAYPNPGSDYSFVGCTVAPGFEFEDFEMADPAGLAGKFPAARDIIEVLA